MQRLEIPGLGRSTSRIGLGCGRLVGRSSLKRSARLVETALELGIRYFDVAPSYGLGTAEDVIGAVLGDSREVTVATKIGVPRPALTARAEWLRRYVKPVLDRAAGLKGIARRVLARGARPAAERPRYDFSAPALRASLEESLRRLRRSSVDVFLAHEPHRLDLTDEIAAGFRGLQWEGLIRAFGVGVFEVADRWAPFGSIWQSGWPGPAAHGYQQDTFYIWHGAIRNRTSTPGGSPPRPAAVVRDALRAAPGSILLVSASTPGRLRELLEDVDA